MNYTNLDKAIRVAVKAHSYQFDKAGLPYILHPLRVAEAVQGEEQKIVAVLHDVVEDTTLSIGDIYSMFGDTIGSAVAAITKREKVGQTETYLNYLDRVMENPLALAVKLADMADNSRAERIENLSVQKQVRLVSKYARGRHYLLTGEWYENKNLDQVIKDGYRK